MKRKTTILLSSILAGSLLVGGAFAAYAVTDNAAPIDITVTPGTPEIPDTKVTLSWGDKAHANISELQRDTLARAAYVTLVSSTEYTGKFSISMADTTEVTKDPLAASLFDNLEVYVYNGEVELDAIGNLPTDAVKRDEKITKETLPGEDGAKHLEFNIGADANGTKLSVFVKLLCEEEEYGQMTDHKVTLTLDWGMGPDSYEATQGYLFSIQHDAGYGKGVFVAGDFNNWTLDIEHRLEYNAQTGTWSKEFPAEPGSEYKFIIADYDTAEHPDWVTLNENNRTVPGENPVTPGTSEEPGTSEQPTSEQPTSEQPTSEQAEQEVLYYLVGANGQTGHWSVDDHLASFVPNGATEDEYMLAAPIELAAGSALKVISADGNNWYPGGDSPNYSVENAGTYQVYFRPNHNGGDDWHYGYFYVEAK